MCASPHPNRSISRWLWYASMSAAGGERLMQAVIACLDVLAAQASTTNGTAALQRADAEWHFAARRGIGPSRGIDRDRPRQAASG